MDSKNYISRRIEDYAFDEGLTGLYMVFLADPRQVGKTRLAKNWLVRKGVPPSISTNLLLEADGVLKRATGDRHLHRGFLSNLDRGDRR